MRRQVGVFAICSVIDTDTDLSQEILRPRPLFFVLINLQQNLILCHCVLPKTTTSPLIYPQSLLSWEVKLQLSQNRLEWTKKLYHMFWDFSFATPLVWLCYKFHTEKLVICFHSYWVPSFCNSQLVINGSITFFLVWLHMLWWWSFLEKRWKRHCQLLLCCTWLSAIFTASTLITLVGIWILQDLKWS